MVLFSNDSAQDTRACLRSSVPLRVEQQPYASYTQVPTKGSLLALPPADYKWKTLVYTAGVQLIQSLKRIPVYPEPSVFPRARAPYFTNPHSSYTTLTITQDALVSLVFMSAIPSLFIIITYFSFSIQHAQFTYFLLKLSLWPWLSASRIPGRCAYDYTLKCRKKIHNILGFSAYKSFYFADRVTTCTPPPNFIFLKTDITRI